MNRRHDIDALRAAAFGLLILFHVGMLYIPGWDWHIKSSYPAPVLDLPMIFLNRWRMDLIFLISGVATAFMMRGRPLGAFVRQRTSRLLIPFAFAMAVVIPIQPYCQGVANGLVEPGFLRFLTRYFTGYPWPKGAFDGWQYGVTWNHLWYLPYLFFYTLVLAALQPLLESPRGRRLGDALASLRGWRLLLYPALPFFVLAVALGSRFPQTHAFFDDWYSHARYFAIFAYGGWLAFATQTWAELARVRKASLLAALAVFLLYWVIRAGEPSGARLVIALAFRSVYAWLAIATILGWGHAYLDKPFRWLPFATEAVYPWYILHQSLIVLIAYWLVPLKLGGLLEAALVLSGTIAGCALLHVGLIRRFGFLRAAFGIVSASRTPSRRSLPARSPAFPGSGAAPCPPPSPRPRSARRSAAAGR